MQPDKGNASKLAKWLQVRKDLVKLLAEAKATRRKMSEQTLDKIVSGLQSEKVNLNRDLLFKGIN